MIVVISVGSVLMSDFNSSRIKEFATVIEELAADHQIFVVVGGGKVAREYIKLIRDLGADETSCDYVGIDVTLDTLREKLGLFAVPDGYIVDPMKVHDRKTNDTLITLKWV